MSKKYFNKMHLSRMVLMIPLVFISFNVFCQLDDNRNEVTVVAAYEPTISDAFKINFSPVIKDTVFEKPQLSYSIQSVKIPTSFQIEPIKAAKIVGEPITKLYKNLVKVGLGTYTTPYFEFFSNSVRSKSYAYGIHAKHLSSSGKITGYGNSGFADNEININGKYYLKKAALDGEVFFNHNIVHYYGYKPADFPGFSEDTKQYYALFGFNSSYSSNYTDSTKLNHQFTLGFYNLSDNYSRHENNIKLGVNLDKELHLFDFTDKQLIGIKTQLDYNNNGGSLIPTVNSTLLKLNPYITTEFNAFNFLVGFDATIASASGGTTELYLSPDLEASMIVVPKVLNVYAGISGGVHQNTFKSISDENPFIKTNVPLALTDEKFRIFGGINTSLTKSIDFNAGISDATIDNEPFYVNDTNNITHNKFTLVYDKVNLFELSAGLLYKYDEKFNIAITANFYKYTTTRELKAWQKPSFEATLSLHYNISNKIICNADVFMISRLSPKTIEAGQIKVKDATKAFDVNLGVEYRYSKILSAFIKLNNLGAVRYQDWYNYPNQRFSLMGGFTYAF
ncbi:MAG: hypothetical protein NTZ33_06780 [Bacteroidetes bacterium]|nr:hypothetical protein [Bacteroidota bacterium]